MSKLFRISLFSILILGIAPFLKAQESTISEAFKARTIEKLNELMIDHYVFPEIAEKTAAHLNKQWKAGHFKDYKTPEAFGEALTTSVQEINHDKHMRIRPSKPYKAPEDSPERRIEEQLDDLNFVRRVSGGFHTVEKLEGNVGYLDLRGFAPVQLGGPIADNYMALLSTSDAIIIDLRKNGGGDPSMVQYLCSFFFDKKVHLNSLYWRKGNKTHEFWTHNKINGKRLPDVPLFVLTSDRTFSAAEEFSYNMQTQKRATLVGQTSGGGANPGGMMPLNKQLSVFIPTGKAINPITQTNWEGVGVIPEVKTSPEETLEKAHELAKTAAEEYRNKSNKRFRSMLKGLHESLDTYASHQSAEVVQEKIKEVYQAGLLQESSINMLGYDYLMRYKKPQTAEAIFKTNIHLFPASANAYDSYAEALLTNGDLKNSMKNYQKAVNLAEKHGDENLELFKENLNKVKAQMQAQK